MLKKINKSKHTMAFCSLERSSTNACLKKLALCHETDIVLITIPVKKDGTIQFEALENAYIFKRL